MQEVSGIARCTSASGPHPKWTDGLPCNCSEKSTSRGGGQIIGTWESREHWARWHNDETFKATRAELAGLEDGQSATVWNDVVEEQG